MLSNFWNSGSGLYNQANKANREENPRSLSSVRQIGCLPQNQVMILLLNSVNLNVSYPKTNRINHSVSFGNMNCLLMHFNPDIFQFELKINIQIFEITSTCCLGPSLAGAAFLLEKKSWSIFRFNYNESRQKNSKMPKSFYFSRLKMYILSHTPTL